MRKSFGVFAAGLLALGVAGQAQAAALNFTGSLGIQLATLAPVVITGTGVATVNGSGGGPHVNTLSVANSPFQITGFVLPVTDPMAAPIKGVQVTAHNATGVFAGGSVMGGLGGKMPVKGTAKICLFSPCSAAAANVSVPLTVVGSGGSATVATFVNVTVIGAPWTESTAAVGTITQMGFVHGPATGTSTTAGPSGVVRLVTPIFVSTNIPASSVVPAFGILTLHFVPEPGTLVLLGSGIAGLVMFGRSRRS
jgi:hypothetical protein